MRFFRYVSVAVLSLCLLVTTPSRAVVIAVDQSPYLPQSPLKVSAYSIDVHGAPQYVEIYNGEDELQYIADWSLKLEWANKTAGLTAPPPVTINPGEGVSTAYLVPDGHMVVGFGTVVTNPTLTVPELQIPRGNYLSKLSLMNIKYRPYEKAFAANVVQTPMRLSPGATSRYTTTSIAEYLAGPQKTELYMPRDEPGLRVVELLPNPATCQPFDTALVCSDYAKVYNTSAGTLDLAGLRLRTGTVGQNATSSNTLVLGGVLAPGAYGVFPLTLTNSGGNVWLEDTYGTRQYQDTVVTYPDASSKKGQAWAQDAVGQWRWTKYPSPYDAPNQFTDGLPVNVCNGLRLNEIGANLAVQFIELANTSDEPLSLAGCQLQTNRSSDVSYVFGDQTLAPGELVTVAIADTKLSLTKTTTGTVYVLSSDGQTEVDARSYENLSENTSYALVDGVWQQTFVTTPGAANIYEPYVPCQQGYERNLDTGRCNKIVVAATPAPCDIDEYRSPDTGRCRKLTSATSSSLTPCKEGQYRSPETNRCRSAAAASSELKPCAAGQERNPDTNRCRKVTQGDGNAGFSVVDTPSSADQLLSWLAIGGMGVASLGYAAWEWRREVWSGLSGLLGMLPFGK